VVCGALSAEDGVRLVAERGRLMADVQARHRGAMAAVLGLAPERVRALCPPGGGAEVANVNAPTQVVVSGPEPAIAALQEPVARAGGRFVPLAVGAAFHSAAMAPVRDRLEALTRTMRWADAAVPLASNVSGRLVWRGEDVRAALVAQVAAEVRWVDCVRALHQAGATAYLELGARPVLAGLIRAIDPGAEVVNRTQAVAAVRDPRHAVAA
jgi:[acyl-carrier-protein] S-malonyltransferase